ncbi:hypothetical protein LLG95_09470 [bacterium]|nr:hypothetical protein [bacterium]
MDTQPDLKHPASGERGRFFSARLLVTVAIAAAWLASMHAVWRHEVGTGQGLKQIGVSPEVLLVTWTNYDHLLWIVQNGRTIGATQMFVIRHEERDAPRDRLPGYELTSRTRMKPTLMGMPLPVDISLVVGMNGQFEMETLQGTIRAAGQPMHLDAFVEGGSLYYRARIGNGSPASPVGGALASILARRDICGRAPLGGPIVMHDILLPLLIHEGKLRPGQTWTTDSSDPIAGLLHQTARITVVGLEKIRFGGEDVPAWHLTEQIGDTKTESWYGLNGRPLRSEAPDGLLLVQAESTQVKKYDPGFGRPLERAEIDRDYIRSHIDPQFDNKPLESLLPGLPSI